MTSWGHLGDDLGLTWALLWQNLARLVADTFGQFWQSITEYYRVERNENEYHTMHYTMHCTIYCSIQCIMQYTLHFTLHSNMHCTMHCTLHCTIHCTIHCIISASLITADGAYHCPMGSIWPSFILFKLLYIG